MTVSQKTEKAKTKMKRTGLVLVAAAAVTVVAAAMEAAHGIRG